MIYLILNLCHLLILISPLNFFSYIYYIMLVKTLLFNKPKNIHKNIKNINNKNKSSNKSSNKSKISSSTLTLLNVSNKRKRVGGCGCGRK
jgi:hypothetical protein